MGIPKAFGTGGTGGGVERAPNENPCPWSLPPSEKWKIEPEWECCDFAYECPLFFKVGVPRNLISLELGVDGRN